MPKPNEPARTEDDARLDALNERTEAAYTRADAITNARRAVHLLEIALLHLEARVPSDLEAHECLREALGHVERAELIVRPT